MINDNVCWTPMHTVIMGHLPSMLWMSTLLLILSVFPTTPPWLRLGGRARPIRRRHPPTSRLAQISRANWTWQGIRSPSAVIRDLCQAHAVKMVGAERSIKFQISVPELPNCSGLKQTHQDQQFCSLPGTLTTTFPHYVNTKCNSVSITFPSEGISCCTLAVY